MSNSFASCVPPPSGRAHSILLRGSAALLALLLPSAAGAISWISNSTCVEAVYVVPPGITRLHVAAIGAKGEDGTSDNTQGNHFGRGGVGGFGTKMFASVDVIPGQPLYVGVADPYDGTRPPGSGLGGGPGFSVNVGPTNLAGAGGGATFITTADPRAGGGCAPANSGLLLVAAGGGAGGGAASFANGGNGGTELVFNGTGQPGGQNRQDDGGPGIGASIIGPGPGGAQGSGGNCISGTTGATGGSFQGGEGGDGGSSPGGTVGCQPASAQAGTGAGGGAGRFGGGGGGGGSDNSGAGAAAGGGGGAGISWFAPSFVTLEQPLQRACSNLCRLTDEPVISIVPFDTSPTLVTGSAFTLTAGVPVEITLRAGGYPLPQVGISNRPAGIFQHDNGDGTLTLSGTPEFYAGGVTTATLIASNTDSAGVFHQASQGITFTVNARPRFTNPTAQAFFEVGIARTFDVASYYGYPQPVLTLSGALPPGLALVDNHDGTGSITGTPTQGGIFDVVLNATNGVGPPVTQAIRVQSQPIPFTVTVGSNANPSAPGQSVSFSAQLAPIPVSDPYVEFKIDGVQFGGFVPTNGLGLAVTQQTTALASGPHVVTARVLPGGIYGTGIGQLTQQVSVVSGPASGTTLSATPSTNEVFVQNGRVYNLSIGALDVGISAVGNGIAVDSAGNTYTFGQDLGQLRVRRTTPGGSSSFIGPAPLSAGAYGLGVDGQGFVYAVERTRIDRIAPGGGTSVVLSNSNYFLREAAVDSAGNAFVVNFTGSEAEVLQVSPPYTGEPTRIASGLVSAGGLAVDAADNLFVSDTGAGNVYRYSLITGARTTVVTGLSAGALAIDAAGTLYIAAGTSTFRLLPPYTGALQEIDSGRDVRGIATRQRAAAPFGQPVLLTANVVSGPAGAYPAGNVTFRDGAATLGTVALNASGVATLTTSALPLGTRALTATYNGGAAFPTSTGAREVLITPSPVPVTVSGTRVRGSTSVTFTYVVGALPPGITGVTGTLSGCASSTLPGAPVGTYPGTIFGCAGLSPTGPAAGSYAVQYLDGGVAIVPQPLPINVAGRMVVATGVVAFTWTTPITLPTGTSVTGTLSGCSSTVNASTPLGIYTGTISGCTGLAVTGPAAADYALAYVDAGVEVVPLSIAVTVTATKPFGGGVVPAFSYTPQPTFPSGVTGVVGTLAGCTSTVAPTTPVGTYNGTISACGGLVAQGPQAAAYSIAYIDGGVTVTARGVDVQVYGFQLPGGTPLFRYSVAGGFPRDINSAIGPISGCTTTVTAAAPPGNYAGTIGACGGLQVFTDTGVTYAITYVDAGFTVGPGGTTTSIAPTTATDPDLFITSLQQRHAILHPPPYTQAPVILGGPLPASGSAFDSRGNLLATDFSNLYVFDPAGNLRRTVPLPFPLSPIALDANDNVYGVVLEDNSRAAVWRLDYPYTGTLTLVKAGFGGVSTIAFDDSDRLWVGDQFGRFPTVLEPPYTGAALIVVQPPIFSSSGFAVDGAMNYFNGVSSNGPGTASRTDRYVPPYTAPPSNWSGDQPSSNFGPRGLTADRQGNLWGGDSIGLFRIAAAGGAPTRYNNDPEFRSALQVSQSSPPARAAVGSPVSVTITVGSLAGGTPTGTVRVFEGATQLGSGTLAGGKATISIPGLAEGTHFLTASYLGAAPYSVSGSNKLRAIIGRDSPTILFSTPPPIANGASASVGAIATSGLAITYSSTSPACSVTPAGVVTGLSVGNCIITATAAGNATFLPALPTTITLPVGKGNQAITFGTAPTLRVGSSASVTATASSGLPVVFSATSSTCSVTPAGLVTGLSVGPCTIAAAQSGNANYNAAPPATQLFDIGQGTQAITFDALPAVSVGSMATVAATGGGSFNPVTFSSTSSTCTVGASGAVTGLHVGSCAIVASQAGNTNYQPGTASTSLAVAQSTQAINFGAPTSVLVGGSGGVSATATSGLAVTFSTSSANCSVTSTGAVTGLHGGPCVINGAQGGNVDYLPAPPAALTIAIGRANQSIVFGSAPAVVVGGTGNVTATGGASGNTVTFATGSATCSVSTTGTVTGLLAGPCLVLAAQAGNSDYNAATQATQVVAVARGPQAITFGAVPTVEVLGTGTVTAATPGSLPVSFSSASANCTVTPAGVVSGVSAGLCVVDAAQAGDANWLPAPPASLAVPVTLVVRTTDLAIQLDDGTGGTHSVAAGSTIDYTVIAANLGANTARGARVDDVLPAGLTGASWSCEVPPVGSCTLGGAGDMHALATIPPGGSIVFRVAATVAAQPESFANTASVATGATETDSVAGNNSATVVTGVVVFADGFEAQSTLAPVVITVAADRAKTEIAPLDLSGLAVAKLPQLAATIRDTASVRRAQVFVRSVDSRTEVRLSWRDDAGRWSAGEWIALTGDAPLVMAWSTEAAAAGRFVLDEVDIAQGDVLIDRAGK